MTSRWLSILGCVVCVLWAARRHRHVWPSALGAHFAHAAPTKRTARNGSASASTWKTTPILAQTNATAPGTHRRLPPTPQPGTNNTQFTQPAAPQSSPAPSTPPAIDYPLNRFQRSRFPRRRPVPRRSRPTTQRSEQRRREGVSGLRPIEPLKDIRTINRESMSRGSRKPRPRRPNEAGQVWREYDITPYTARVTSTNRPEQAIIDWVLRETGTRRALRSAGHSQRELESCPCLSHARDASDRR